jgi:hypothetical protein
MSLMKRSGYDTVRYLRPLPRANGAGNDHLPRKEIAMSHLQDNDADKDEGRVKAEACMKLLNERFPHVQALALKRCEQHESFRELCEEYWACTQVLARLERPDAEESLRTEYGALRLRLEGELLRYIAEQSVRAGSPQP